MPYSRQGGRGFERSRSTGHVPIVENEQIQARLRSGFKIFGDAGDSRIAPEQLIAADTLHAPRECPKWVMSFDGSPNEVPVRERYPSTRVGYIQIAGVLVHLEEMLAQQHSLLVDPAVIRRASEEALHSMVLPGSNICRNDMTTVRDSWRAEVFDIFQQNAIEGVPLLDVYVALVAVSDKASRSGGITVAHCPATPDCVGANINVPATGADCPICGGRVFPTDALRIHEEVAEEHPNLTALGRLMTVVEHLTFIAYVRYLQQRQARVLGSVAFIMDGPLALFGPQAWLHTAILNFLKRSAADLQAAGLAPPVIIGIEKGGQFAEHADAIADRIPARTVMTLPDDYIYKYILTFRSAAHRAYGHDTYYGQKFFYRTAQGQLLTITIPKLAGEGVHDAQAYGLLPTTLLLLDRIGTSLYKDATIPIALAHQFASIPLRTGSRVLTLLSRRLLSATDSA
jgi:hypothetical protein